MNSPTMDCEPGSVGRAAGDDRAEHHVALAAVAAEQQRPGALDERVQREPMALRQRAQRLARTRPDSVVFSSASRAGGAAAQGRTVDGERRSGPEPGERPRQYASAARTSCCCSQRM